MLSRQIGIALRVILRNSWLTPRRAAAYDDVISLQAQVKTRGGMMAIMVVDDCIEDRWLLQRFLRQGGYNDMLLAESATDAFELLGLRGPSQRVTGQDISLVIMDVSMPDVDGVEACRRMKENPALRDIPVMMVTANEEVETLEAAFAAGAVDYVVKPVDRLELIARIRSALRLKSEMDERKAREDELLKVTRQLADINEMLQRLASEDALTGAANRRMFDEVLRQEWMRAMRDKKSLSLAMVDVDHFKAYNDFYGHHDGDHILKSVAVTLSRTVRRPSDFVARYGGEEFCIILPGTRAEGARRLAEKFRRAVEALGIEHTQSEVCPRVTVSVGVATVIPDRSSAPEDLVCAADRAMYQAKSDGRNRVRVFGSVGEGPH